MHRRQSLFGPLLLILLGTLLLVHNFSPDFPFWDLVGRYWPVVLVVWGLAKLVEALRRPSAEGPWRPSLSIGEFFLAMLLVMVGLAASKGSRFVRFDDIPGWPPWSREYFFTQNLHQAGVAPNTPVRVEVPRGDVTIHGADGNEIAVTVTKRIREGSEADARSIDQSLQAYIVREGTEYVIRVGAHVRAETDLDIRVPKATPLRLEARRGDVHVSSTEGELAADISRGSAELAGVKGNIKVQLRRGSLSARNIEGNVEVEGSGNDIQVADVSGQLLVRGEFSGASEYERVAQGVRFSSSRTEMEIQKLPGKVDMTIGSLAITEPGGAVMVHTRNKDIRVEDFTEKLQIFNRGADVELRTTKLPLKDIEVENHSGGIRVTLPEKSEFQVDALARRGEVDSEFAVEVERTQDTGTIRGKVGGAAASIKLNTTYGTIRLERLPAGEQAGPGEREPKDKPPRAPTPPKRPVRAEHPAAMAAI